MTARPLACALAAAAAAALAAPAAGATTWAGRCELIGSVTTSPRTAALPAPMTYRDEATGSCTGTLDGEQVTDAPAVLSGTGDGAVGCLAAASSTDAELRFTRGTADPDDDGAIAYRSHARGGATQYVATAIEERFVLVGHFDFLTRGDPGTIAACQTGTLETAHYRGLVVVPAR